MKRWNYKGSPNEIDHDVINIFSYNTLILSTLLTYTAYTIAKLFSSTINLNRRMFLY